MQRNLYQPFRTGCFDYLEGYHGIASVVLGTTLVLFGLLSIALGIGAICTLASGYYIGYGIWCGILFCLVGFLCVCAGYKKNMCLVVATCACCTINLGLSLCQIAIAIAAAKNDNLNSRGDIQMKRLEAGYLSYDIYYARNNPYKYLCSGPNSPFTWRTSWGPVDVLLILSGFIVFFVSLAAAIMTCIQANRGTRIVLANPFAINESPEMFGHESYTTEKRIGEPNLIMA